MKCVKCGASLKDGETFCSNCGTSTLTNSTINNNNNKNYLVVIIPIAIIVMLIIAIVVVYFKDEAPIKYNDDKKIDDLSIYVPKDFELKDSRSDFIKKEKQYDLENDELGWCSFNIVTVPNYDYKDAGAFIEDKIEYTNKETYSGLSKVTIEGNEWYTASIEGYSNKKYYAIEKNERIYKIEFNTSGTETCKKAEEDVIKLSKFK